jgi:hypothetical protein
VIVLAERFLDSYVGRYHTALVGTATIRKHEFGLELSLKDGFVPDYGLD